MFLELCTRLVLNSGIQEEGVGVWFSARGIIGAAIMTAPPYSLSIHADDYYYTVDGKWEPEYSSAEEACKVKHSQCFSQEHAQN